MHKITLPTNAITNKTQQQVFDDVFDVTKVEQRESEESTSYW